MPGDEAAFHSGSTGNRFVHGYTVTAASAGVYSTRHYYGPDLLRLLASSLVVLFHLGETGGNVPSWPVMPAEAPLGWLHPFAWMGWVGVQMFFVLSGFLIAASAVNSTPARFVQKRAIRIFPALWISCVIALIARMLWGEPLAELLPALLRSAILSPKGPYLDGVIWTLVVEVAFYVVVYSAIVLSHRQREVERCLVRLAFAIGIASTAFTLACRIAATAVEGEQLFSFTGSFAFDVLLLRQGMFFAIGMLLFHLIEHHPTRPILAWLAVFVFAAGLQIDDTTAATGNPFVPILIWGTASVLMFASVKYSHHLPRPERFGFIRNLGLLTYPLYLNHFVLSQALMPLLAFWLPERLIFPVLFGTLLVNAWFISWGPERWLQRWLGTRRFALAPKVNEPKPNSPAS